VLPPEVVAMAKAVVAGDEVAAFALYDALGELRAWFTAPRDSSAFWHVLGRRVNEKHMGNARVNIIRKNLERVGYFTAAEVAAAGPSRLAAVQEIGPASLRVIRESLLECGLRLAEEG
jgi:hypothetical protein